MNKLKLCRRLLWLFILGVWFTPYLVQAAGPLDPKYVKTPKMTPELNLGKMLYDGMCSSCHGKNTAGSDKGPTFLHRVYHPGHHGDGAFSIAPKQGVKAYHWKFADMPPVEGITDKHIDKIIVYIRAMQKVNGLF